MNELLKFSLQALEKTTLEEFSPLLVKELTKVTQTRWGSIFLFDKEQRLQRVFTTLPKHVKKIQEKEDLLCEKMMVSYSSKKTKLNSTFFDRKHLIDTNTIYAFPLLYQNQGNGVIFLSSDQPTGSLDGVEQKIDIITSLAMLTIKNIQLAEELRESLNQKELFIATAAHELRTPLAVISSYNQLIRKKMDSGKEIKRSWPVAITRNVKELESLIVDLFSATQIAAGIFKYSFRKVNLISLVKRVIQDLSNVYEQHIVFHSEHETLDILGDSLKIQILLVNIINNAAKYSSSDSTIWIELTQENNMIVLSCKDEGSGIKKADIEKVFDKNYRGSNRKGSGLGLGLYLCSEIVKKHHGEIQVHSIKGKSTTLTIRLPKYSVTREFHQNH